MFTRNRRRLGRRLRGGTAAVETAVCLPVVVLLLLGSLEACSAIFLRQALAAAAYESARVAIRADGSSAQATARAEEVLQARGVSGQTVTFSPADVSQAARGQYVTVTISAPYGSNGMIPSRYLGLKDVAARAVMVKE